ncbi:MAG TPA: murein L,D-transpeptidase catalytic domain family protein [Stenotrophomonas sp.]
MRASLKIAAVAALCGLAATAPAKRSPPAQAPLAAAAPVPQPTLATATPGIGLVDALARQAPTLDRQVLSLATEALQCARHRQQVGADAVLSVIDYSRPSTERRLWVFDLARQRLLFQEWVAHGRNSGDNLTAHFSNADGSYMSSLGAFTAQETYTGHNGYSLRLQGLEPGFNDNARGRAIVIHGAPYVSEALIHAQGRLGRSLGCPAVRPAIARQLIDTLRGGSFVFAYYPDTQWLKRSRLLAADCGGSQLAQVGSSAASH